MLWISLLALALSAAFIYLGYLTAWAAVLSAALKVTVAVASLSVGYAIWCIVRRKC